eukprot:Nitzschia sp. Nitz4//scaffold221_size33835//940//7855//NITZ4_007849-RA/size33835-augustus-gene-0.0-mRNA-1//1//CDS//3329542551//7928//frame0
MATPASDKSVERSAEIPSQQQEAPVASIAGSLSEEVPFLVTNWLVNYSTVRQQTPTNDTQRQALERFRRATAEIASSLSVLGAFGESSQPTLFDSNSEVQEPRKATFADMRRRWKGTSGSHLEHLVQAAVTTSSLVDAAASEALPCNVIEASYAKESTLLPSRGRTVQDAINVETDSKSGDNVTSLTGTSALQPPVVFSVATSTAGDEQPVQNIANKNESFGPLVPTQSLRADIGHQTANAMRSLFDVRERVRAAQKEMRGIHVSLAKQKTVLEELNEKYNRLSVGADMTKMLQISDEVNLGKQDCERVTAQLQRRLTILTQSLVSDEKEMVCLQAKALQLEKQRKETMLNFRDPFGAWKGKLAPGSKVGGNALLMKVIGRQYGTSGIPRSLSMGPEAQTRSKVVKSMFASRFSHAATINAHLSYPVYCLRFDRTGRYFVTGADDYLVKLFYIGGGISCQDKMQDGSRRRRCNFGANLRGAVHVISLRGHAGVINDIDISSDNAFLATASVDGDVRVWGLKDGCPVAILRGHKGGANMVSWSKLTPFRLISTSADGFARVWDVREACLKRYNAHVGKRPEYRLRLLESEKKRMEDENPTTGGHFKDPPRPPLPPAPLPNPGIEGEGPRPANAELVVPPLPPAVPPLPGNALPPPNAPQNQNENIPPPGQFVANDLIDEGVKLLSKHNHGSTGPALAGPGTRARTSTVNVICISRCPLGGYFATGSDDGICRVYVDIDEEKVSVVDMRGADSFFPRKNSPDESGDKKPAPVPSDLPVSKLVGHVSAVTDLSYSHNGDRILSASQKDGVVRLWNLGTKVVKRHIPQVVLKLTNPVASNGHDQASSRRTPGNSSRNDSSKVSCDVAVWTCDDTKVVTSQSILLKQSGSEIKPGSQYLFLWDSHNGQCLMGIAGGHTMQCPVVIPHPLDSTMLCTAAADGFVKVWDWTTGKCIFKHKNVLDFGPIEATERGKAAGYLDGAFNDNGTCVVLTDDSGRLTILDTAVVAEGPDSNAAPAWMREQYFANDYYEMYYDRNGYCIERGSERPPHLAPRGAKCNHSGAPWSDNVSEAFSKLVGPSPLSVKEARWIRETIRRKSSAAPLHDFGNERGAVPGRIHRGVREYDPNSTILIHAEGFVPETPVTRSARSTATDSQRHAPEESQDSSSRGVTSRALSANYRYLDYEDMMRDQGIQDEGELDSDDEEFNPTAARNQQVDMNSDNSDEDDMDLDDLDDDPIVVASRTRRQAEHRPDQREQRSRRRAQRREFIEPESDDEFGTQYVSTNNTPSGPYAEDYTTGGHFWRMPSGNVRRKWLRRLESDTSFEGRKIYTPQLGDSIVYIPRAHYLTLNDFPSFEPPWQRWPQGAAWPVVRCSIRGIRYRFPFEDYYRSSQGRCNSVVAILTLEVTGIPEISEDREFPWPRPSFVDPTRAFVFELRLFEHDKCDFVYPEELYTGRLRALEASLRETGQIGGLPVNVYYSSDGPQDSPMEVYHGEIVGLGGEEPQSSPHLSGSGFGVVSVDMVDSHDEFSPWDICMPTLSIERPCLSEEDKKLILDNLNVQSRKESVAQLLSTPVDKSMYSDYDRMVEVEMNLMTVKRRLTSNYYSNKLSVVGDLRLIRDNCIKYNSAANDLATIATEMCLDFESRVLNDDEKKFIITEEEYVEMSQSLQPANSTAQAPTTRLRLRMQTNHVSAPSPQPIRRRTSNNSRNTDRASALERLPEPPVAPTRRRGLRSETQPSVAAGQSQGSAALGGRSLRSRGPAPDPEAMNQDIQGDFQGNTRQTGRTLRSQRHPRESLSRISDSMRSPEEIEDGSMGLPSTRRGRSRNLSAQFSAQPAELPARRSSRSRTQTDPAEEATDVVSPRRNLRSNVASMSHESDVEDEPDASESSSGSESPDEAPRPTRRSGSRLQPTRQNGRSAARTRSHQQQSDDDFSENKSESEESEDESEEEPPSPRRRSPPARRQQPRSSGRSTSAGTKRGGNEEDASDFEPELDESEESDEEEASPRGRARKVKSYAEYTSDSDLDDEDDWEKPPRAKASSKKRPAPKRSSPSPKKKKAVAKDADHMNSTEWPDIEMKDITRVCNALLSKIEQDQRAQPFLTPVLEEFPQLAKEYLRIVPHPMDLRTIAEERIHLYEHINELQKDLTLTFQNCIDFNGFRSALGKSAMSLLVDLNDFFTAACKEENVLLPRRWKP